MPVPDETLPGRNLCEIYSCDVQRDFTHDPAHLDLSEPESVALLVKVAVNLTFGNAREYQIVRKVNGETGECGFSGVGEEGDLGDGVPVDVFDISDLFRNILVYLQRGCGRVESSFHCEAFWDRQTCA